MSDKFPMPFGGVKYKVLLKERAELNWVVQELIAGCRGQHHEHNFAVDTSNNTVYTSALGVRCIKTARVRYNEVMDRLKRPPLEVLVTYKSRAFDDFIYRATVFYDAGDGRSMEYMVQREDDTDEALSDVNSKISEIIDGIQEEISDHTVQRKDYYV